MRVGGYVDDGHDKCAQEQSPADILLRVLDLPGNEGHVVPGVAGKQSSFHGKRQWRP